MYLRETKRRNKDGTTVSYLHLAHNVRHPDTGVSTATIVHNFGRADQVDRAGLARLVRSIARVLDPTDQVVALAADDVRVVDGRDLGGAWVLDQLWSRLGIGAAIAKVAAGRRIDASVERVLFALAANRALAPSSKLEASRWVAEEVAIDGLAEVSHTSCYRTMDFLLDALAELQRTVFFTVADLLNLDVDLLFFDTTSTYFEIDQADAAPEGSDARAGFRTHGKSKDHRPDPPQVIIGMAVTRGGIPVRCWTWPGNTQDQTVIAQVKADLAGWQLGRVVWVTDSGFNSEHNRRELQRGGCGYIVAERLRGNDAEVKLARARQGRYHTVADNLEVKQVWVGDGVNAQRFVICRNLQVAKRDATVRAQLIEQLEAEIAGSDKLTATERAELAGRLKAMPGYRRLLRATPTGRLRIDRTAARRDAHLDGKFLLRTCDHTLSPTDIAQGYKALWEVERGWRDMKHTLDLRPVHHRKQERVQAHVQLCWLGLLLIRVAETAVGDTWRNIRAELDRMQLVTLATAEGTIAQRTLTTPGQRVILGKLELPEPPRYFDFTPTAD